ncbi:3486_t:CDS:1 [Funneliformis mosseae]|uniref:3486_t:CDS:1 n=1 Tax=Funneliformis mosseae TaxID=27381 RepID=A0A9N8ZQK7_FUNMO|nr:3486_t:CDS:1 [Funneliformis mosseae]
MRREGRTYDFLITYLLFLNNDDKAKLKEFGVEINSSSFKKPFFNYPSFIKTLNTFRVELHVVNLINNLSVTNNITTCSISQIQRPLPNTLKSDKITFAPIFNVENTSLELEQHPISSSKIIDFICVSLFKLFISNEISLNNLYLNINYYHLNFISQLCKFISDNPKFLSGIKDFTLDFSHKYRNIFAYPVLYPFQSFLMSLPSVLTSSIKHFSIYFGFDKEMLTARNLERLIQSQTQLLSLSFYSITANVAYLLGCLSYSSNTLTSIKFNYCDFTNISSFNGLNYLSHLESLQFIHCKGITVRVFQPLLNIPTPLKIKTLKLEGQIAETVFIQLLLQKAGSYVENLELKLWVDVERKRVFESIIKYCDKIQFLHLYEIDYVNIPQLYKLITQVRKNLKYLSLQNKNYHPPYILLSGNKDNLRVSSMILENLGQILPSSLNYLDLNLVIDPTNFKDFLDNCKHFVRLSRLLVKNKNIKEIDDTFNILKKFVKENEVTNFAYQVNSCFNPDDFEHQNLEKLVNDIQPSIKMNKYSDLVIRISDFDYF